MQQNTMVLKTENLSVSFKNKSLFKTQILDAVEDINLSVSSGEFVALVGESGCGKTITAKSIINLLPENAFIKSGKIIFDGQEIQKLSKKQFSKILGKDISIIFQDPMTSLNPLKKIESQILEAATVHGTDKITAKTKAISLLKLMNFSEPDSILKCYPSELSGGMLQRILIAIALINEPKLLIADEPTTALDATIQKQILSILFDLNKKLEISILLITHDLNIVSDVCNRMYVMYAGQIIESGDTKTIMTSPSHPYTKALVQAIPDLHNKDKKLPVITGTVPSLEERKNLNCRFYDRCDFRKEKNISERCTKSIPMLKEITQGDNGHLVRCSYYKECLK
ncbi:ABC transporter ATP-binding protein [Treponema sp.]|uniref:ABC transporter ATP-binding protein n=1 Tax=Treponema sp. TaxID=166 RepID=UPI00298EB889|nr:ABC transporter ATP-binding protein [Treponema sp.]MCR5613137.1 ABC transporter ATP-binding protein [Treponema sp.]